MRPGQFLALRAAAALVLMAVFFASALLASALLVWLGVETLLLLDDAHGRGLLVILVFASACISAAGVILWSIVPRIDRFEPPGQSREADGPGAVPRSAASRARRVRCAGPRLPRPRRQRVRQRSAAASWASARDA
jgi:hypothetical protein